MTGRRLLLALLVAFVLTGCVRMPTSGPVVVREGAGETETLPGTYFDPKPPQPGQSAGQVVAGFLEAMKAMPIRTSVAAQFLSERAQAGWSPEDATITYAEAGETTGELVVRVRLTRINRYDDVGAWQGRRAGRELEFSLAQEDGEWRIDEVPDALIVPESWFQDWYRRVSLYFFDPTARILVPEPVFVPEGEQLATSLVRGLFAERPPGRGAATRTFFPAELDPPLSVPITPTGVAEVSLGIEGRADGDLAAIDDLTTERMLTQLAWTLQQDLRLRALRLSVEETSLPLPGGLPEVSLDFGAAYDPNGDLATADLFGLRGGRLVRGPVTDLRRTPGPMGARRLGVRSVGVSLGGTTAAGVSGDGTSLLVAPVDDVDGSAVQVVSGAEDLLDPAWDFADRLWLVDRHSGRARVLVVVGREVRAVRVPGVTGKDVTRFLVSRDGTRLVSVVRGRRGDHVQVSRIVHDGNGRVQRVTPARRIGHGEPERVRDIGWRTPTSVSILSGVTDEFSQVRTVPVEGAPGELATQGTSRVPGRARTLVSTPVTGASAYVGVGGALADLSQPERDLTGVRVSLPTLTFAG